jgi:hypothetical protein
MGILSTGYSLLVEADWMDRDYDLAYESEMDQNTAENREERTNEATLESVEKPKDEPEDEPCGTIEDLMIALRFIFKISFSFHPCLFLVPQF